MDDGIQAEWRTKHVIRSYDVDLYRTARLPVLCSFMQDAAIHHAEHLGLGHTFLGARNLAWVLARQRVRIQSMPKLNDSIQICTWPSGMDRLFFYRDFEITDGKGNLLLQSSTAFFVIDLEKRTRQSSSVFLEHERPAGPQIFSKKTGRLPACGDVNRGPVIHVGFGDLDFNAHVNNVRYIEWILGSLPLKFHQKHTLHELEANYLAEALCGHEISVADEAVEPQCRIHDIRSEGRELFRSRTIWKNR